MPVTSTKLPETSINFAGAGSNSLVPLLGGARGWVDLGIAVYQGGAELVQRGKNNPSVQKGEKADYTTFVFSEPLVPLLGWVRGGLV